MNTELNIVTITRVLADGSHVSLGDSTATIEQLVATLDAMTKGREIVDDIFTRHTVSLNYENGGDPGMNVVSTNNPAKKADQAKPRLSNQFFL